LSLDTNSNSLKDLYKNTPDSLIRLLRSRGYQDLESFDLLFRPSLSNLKSPFKLDGMNVLIDRLVKAYHKQEGVLIYGDFDLDGSSGAALLFCGLRDLGFENLYVVQPKRLTDGYGVHGHILEKYINKVQVVLTVDVGITANEATEYAKQNGIDVLITDHHLPKGELPKALAVINPNKGFCNSGLGHLCGVGVGYYVFLALWMRLKEIMVTDPSLFSEEKSNRIKNIDPKSLLDLFVIGTITDLVPLIDENRVLVKHGLKILERTPRPGLRALMQKLGLLGKKLGAQDIGFRLAPKLNSLSRMDKGLLPIDVFLCEDESLAERMVEQILSLNSDRLGHQKQAEAFAIDKVFDSEEDYCFVFDETLHKGVVGLVATRLSQTYHKPSFVGELKNGKISGSARLPDSSVLNLVEIMSECPSLNTFGGHAQAAGFEVSLDKALDFESELKSYFINHKSEIESKASDKNYKYDLELQIHELDLNLISWIEKLEPFGVGFDHPVFKISQCDVIDHRLLKDVHLKFKIRQGKDILDCIWFKHNLNAENLDQLGTYKVDLYGQIEINEYLGQKKLQFMVQAFTTFS
jgi:single-stranded-DNA-specific exonuclease